MNPANTFGYTEVGSAIAANRNVTEPLLTASDTRVYQAHTQTLTNKTIDNTLNTLKLHGAYKYTIFIDTNDSNIIKCMDNDSSTIVSTHATDAKTPIQYAVDNAGGKPIFIQRGNYNIGSSLDLKNKYVTIHGEKTTEYFETVGQTVLKKNYTAGAGDIFIDAAANPYYYVDLRNLVIVGDDEGVGLKYDHNIRYLVDVAIYHFRTGLYLTNTVYVDVFRLVIEDCVDYGLKLITCNTIYFFGCRFKSSDINVYIEDGRVIKFYGCIIEHAISYGTWLESNISAAEPNQVLFSGCTWESASASFVACVYDEGRNNTYHDCKFNTSLTDNIGLHVGANATDINVDSCFFKAANSSSTYRIIIDSGAARCKFRYNSVNTGGQITTFVFDDSGTNTFCIGNGPLTNGNISIPDKVPHNSALISRPDMAKQGAWYGNATTAADGILNSRLAQTAVGTGTSSAGIDSTGNFRTLDTAATINSLAGYHCTANLMERGNHAYFKTAIYLNSISNVRVFAGLTVNAGAAPTSAADPLTIGGVGLWFDSAVNANWKIMHNDTSGASTVDDTGVVAATATLYPIEIYAVGSKFVVNFNGVVTDVSSEIPSGTNNLGFWVYIENTTGASRTMRCYYIIIRNDK